MRVRGSQRGDDLERLGMHTRCLVVSVGVLQERLTLATIGQRKVAA